MFNKIIDRFRTGSQQTVFRQPPQTREDLNKGIILAVAQKIKVDETEIDPNAEFSTFGLDSLMAVSITDEIATWTGLDLDPTIIWELENISQLVDFLWQQLGKSGA